MALHNYYPFGQEATSAGQDEVGLKFTGHERDKTGTGVRSELDYMHARHCSPVVGRFVSVDPARSAESRAPQSWNRYSYGLNSPLKYTDPDGRVLKIAKDSKTQRRIVPVLVRTLRRPSGRKLVSDLAKSDIVFTFSEGKLNKPVDIISFRRGRAGSLRFGVNQNMKHSNGRIVSIDIVLDSAAISAHPIDTTGVTTAAHESSHGSSIAAGQASGLVWHKAWAEGVRGDQPDSATGPASQEAASVLNERRDISAKDAKALLMQFLTP